MAQLIGKSTKKLSKKLIASMLIIIFAVSAITAFAILYYAPPTAKHTILELNLATNNTSVLQGNKLQAEVNVVSLGNSKNVTLGCDVGSSGIQYDFEPAIGLGNFTSSLTLSVPRSTPTAKYSVTITAAGNNTGQDYSYQF